MTTAAALEAACAGLRGVRPFEIAGQVGGIHGLALDLEGTSGHLSIGDRVWITPRNGPDIQAEAIGFGSGVTRAMTFGALDGIAPGAPVRIGTAAHLAVSDQWLGRVIDPLGQPVDGKGALPDGPHRAMLRRAPPNAATRARLGPRIDLGVKVLNSFVTCRQGAASGRVRRLRCGQVYLAVDDGPLHGMRCRGDRSGRRAWARIARVHRG